MVATGLSPQAEQRQSRRVQQLVSAAGFAMLIFIALGIVSGHAAPVIPLVVVALVVPAWLAVRAWVTRDAAGPSGWAARVPTWSLRPYCPDLLPALADEVELRGRLEALSAGLRWTPSPEALRLGASPVDWDRTAGAWTTGRNLGGLPTTYVRVTDARGVSADVWVRAAHDAVRQGVRSSLGEVKG